MKKISPILLIVAFFYSCSQKQNIVGTWTTVGMDTQPSNISDKAIFKEDGSYELLILANSDSLVQKFEGKYILDLKANKIKIEMEAVSFEHTIVSINSNELVMKSEAGQTMKMERIQ